MPFSARLCAFFWLCVPVLLTGCALGPAAAPSPAAGILSMSGTVHGGQQGVSGSTVQLYTIGKTGNGSAAKPMLTPAVTSDGSGFFTLTTLYTCADPEDQVYLTGTGGNPGLIAGTKNDALVMVAALGRCGDLKSTTYTTVNEVTTVAAAWALAPFATSATNIGASPTNALGIKNAFLDSHLIASTSTGAAATLPANLTIETNKLYALADVLANCVNSKGSTATVCSTLFAAATPPTGTSATIVAPADTFTAALNIVKFPGSNVGGVFSQITAKPPFATSFTAAPNDWTMSLTVTGAAMYQPTALDIDALGNVWVTSDPGILSAFTPQGTPLVSVNWGLGSTTDSFGLAIDTSGNVWVSSDETPSTGSQHGSMLKFLGAASGSPGTPVPNTANSSNYFYDATTNYPTALAADTNGNLFIANYAGSTAEVYSSSGVPLTTNMGKATSGGLAFPDAIAIDKNHGAWIGNLADTTATHVDLNGAILADPQCCNGASGIALDAAGYAWIANYYGGNVSLVAPDGTNATLVDGGVDGGVGNGYPYSIAVDAAQNAWVALLHGQGFSELAGTTGYQAAGAALSPANGYGLDANLALPYAIEPDQSGNLWITNTLGYDLVMFFGMAAPTARPLYKGAVAP